MRFRIDGNDAYLVRVIEQTDGFDGASVGQVHFQNVFGHLRRHTAGSVEDNRDGDLVIVVVEVEFQRQ